MPFTKTVYIERGDFREEGPKAFFRLSIVYWRVSRVVQSTVPYHGDVLQERSQYRPCDDRVCKIRQARRKQRLQKAQGVCFSIMYLMLDLVNDPLNCRYIHWVTEAPAHKSPIKVEVRAFNRFSNPQTLLRIRMVSSPISTQTRNKSSRAPW